MSGAAIRKPALIVSSGHSETLSDLPSDLPPCSLDFEEMPALVPGRCNACGAKLVGRQRKTCSDRCKAWWHSQMTSLGRKLAERMVIEETHFNRTKRPKLRKRAFSERGRLVREFLARRREMLSGD